MIAVFWKRGMLADHGRHFEAVHLGHADVHQHDGDVRLQELLQGFVARVRADQVLAEVVEHGFVAQQLARLIVDEEDVDGPGCVHGLIPLT